MIVDNALDLGCLASSRCEQTSRSTLRDYQLYMSKSYLCAAEPFYVRSAAHNSALK